MEQREDRLMSKLMKYENTIYLNGIKGLACLPVFLGHYLGDFSVLPGLSNSILHTIFLGG